MTTPLELLAQVSGIGNVDLKKIAADVTANHARLNSCASHQFESCGGSEVIRRKYRCELCHGTVDMHAYYWYQLGCKHSTDQPPKEP
jgi:hypothetical protein